MNMFYKIIVLSLFCINVQAAGRLYKIELVVFSQNMPNTEVFDQTVSKIRWPKKVVNRSAYQQVSKKYLTLKGSYAQLAKAKGYRPLMHVAWVQSVSANSYGRAVRIKNAGGTINGFFRLQRGSLVHMVADIEYSPRSIKYRLNEKRRFKFNETHYFDHPKFGILARVSPID
jgi:hypothetical protein